MRSAFFLCLTVCCAQAAITDLRVAGTTNTQAVLSYMAPDGAPCTVQVSESPTYSPLVHDVNPALFPGADLDSRSTSANSGRARLFVAGRRTLDKATNTKTYSRALQAATPHYVRVTCGADQATLRFVTATVPLGNTHESTWIPNPEKPGLVKNETPVYNRANRWIDPHTGVQFRFMTLPRDQQEDGGPVVPTSVVSSPNWSDPLNVLSDNGSMATYNGSSCGTTCDWMLIHPTEYSGWRFQSAALDQLVVRVKGKGTSQDPADRVLQLCLVPNASTNTPGTECDPEGLIKEITLPTSSGFVSTSVDDAIDLWRIPGFSLTSGSWMIANGNRVFRFKLRKKNSNGSVQIDVATIEPKTSARFNVGTGGNHDRCSYVQRPDGFYLCTGFFDSGTGSIYGVHGETGEVRFIGEMRQGGSCVMDHSMWDETNPNRLYCVPALTATLYEYTYIGKMVDKPQGYLVTGADFNIRVISSNIMTAALNFYNANQGAWDSILGGAGNYLPFSTAMFGSCGIVAVQGAHALGRCSTTPSSDAPAWVFAMRVSDGVVTAMAPLYAMASGRWCGSHAPEVIGHQAVMHHNLSRLTNVSSSMAAVLPAGVGNQTLTLTSTCTGTACVGWHAGDPVSTYYTTKHLMPLQVNDLLFINGSEYVRITAKLSSTTYTVDRAQKGTSAVAHNPGEWVAPICQSWPSVGSNQFYNESANTVWEYTKSPFGIETDGSKVWSNKYIGHTTGRGDRIINNSTVFISSPGARIYEMEKNPQADAGIYEPIGFGGFPGMASGLSYQTHPSWMNQYDKSIGKEFWLDFRPFVGSDHFSPLTNTCNPASPPFPAAGGCAVARVAGTTNVYKYIQTPGRPLRPKHFEIFGVANTSTLRDISGPGSVISDATPYTMCVANAPGECVAGSAAGDQYVVTPGIQKYRCTSIEGSDACMGNVGYLHHALVQSSYITNKGGMYQTETAYAGAEGAGYSRVLARHGTAGAHRRVSVYTTGKALANGKFGFSNYYSLTEGSQIAIFKNPPYVKDSVDRGTFVPVVIDVTSVPAGTASVVAEFGYSEFWEPDQFRCTTRAESCVAHRSTIHEANPFSFAQTESYTGVACASGCRLTIPAYPSRMVYHRLVYRDASNQVILRGPMRVTAAP